VAIQFVYITAENGVMIGRWYIGAKLTFFQKSMCKPQQEKFNIIQSATNPIRYIIQTVAINFMYLRYYILCI
jgi:hypothetical protein